MKSRDRKVLFSVVMPIFNRKEYLQDAIESIIYQTCGLSGMREVSHNLDTLQSLCNRVMWLHDGEIRQIGEPEEVLTAYREFMK